MAPATTAYVWFDTEYTSLEIDRAALLQVAIIVTDPDLKRLGPSDEDAMFHVQLAEGQAVSPWIQENMPSLLDRCRGTGALAAGDVDKRLAAIVDRCVVVPAGDDKRKPVLAGNSIHADWFLARKFLPQFMSRLHYRHLDVTTLKLQWQDWFKGDEFDKARGDLVAQYFPEGNVDPGEGRRHDAYYDVCASIAELAYYRKQLLKV